MFGKKKTDKLRIYYTSKQWDKLFRLAEKLKRSYNNETRADALRYGGLGNYKRRRYDLAIRDFSALAEMVNFRSDWFNLAMAYVQKGDIENSELAFRKIYSAPPIPGYLHQISVPMMLQLYASILAKQGAWDEALHRITEIKQMFVAANTADEQKLLDAGLPPVKSYLQLVVTILNNFPEKDIKSWLAEMKRLQPFFEDMH
ncbi:tetratricopeptide repeat protein [Saccharicrinis sp. FJH54]|uniref:tetratricopeptide repeat protein n=1 Tax=Saccharicrinis sp. FJH54 TaxID=3344665 RepID=UPI0035D45A70